MARESKTAALFFTGDQQADRLLAEDPLALLIGMVLDQQVRMEKAFRGPHDLRQRLGHLDAGRIARIDPAKFEDIFRARPALHRFPGAMARRVQALCAAVVKDYDGDAGHIWMDVDGALLAERLRRLPGFGDEKVRTLVTILAKRFGIRPKGWEQHAATHMSLGDVDSPKALAAYREVKTLSRAQARSTASSPSSPRARS